MTPSVWIWQGLGRGLRWSLVVTILYGWFSYTEGFGPDPAPALVAALAGIPLIDWIGVHLKSGLLP